MENLQEKTAVKGKDIKIMVATHKKYEMPEDDMYLPISVGAKGQKTEYQGDDEGDNISEKNPYFCELTSLYWAWKNLDNEYIGLAHYRRHFAKKRAYTFNESKKLQKVLSKKQVDELLEDTDIILPKKRKYYIENLYSHYAHTMYAETLDETRKIIEQKSPEYLEEFDKLHKRTSAHIFNMFIMKKELMDKYCEWLFNILFELEKRLDPSKYEPFHARYLGRISELLLDVWINTNKLVYKEIAIINIERINWLKKGIAFLKAKFTGKRYERSF